MLFLQSKEINSWVYIFNSLSEKFIFHYVSIKTIPIVIAMRERPIFTFHYVSIKTYDRCRPAHQNSYLHSTMYLLKPAVRITQSQSLTFTFHYVSIKTYLNYSLYNHHYYLHSTMYLLKLVCRAGQTNT